MNLLVGSLAGAWVGASWAVRLRSEMLFRVIAILLLVIAIVLMVGHGAETGNAILAGVSQVVGGVAAGFIIGVVASLMGVAGGELLIPTLILLYGIDLKLAGSLSLLVSLPTMIVGFARYSRDQAFAVISQNSSFALSMAAGSVVGSLIGALLLGVIPAGVLLPILAAILVLSAVKVWRHK